MRNILFIAVLLASFAGTAQAETIMATVNGLVCSFCATGIEKTFKAQPAVAQVKVDLDKKLVTIHTQPSESMDDDTITKLLGDAGYTVTGIKRE